MFRRHTLSRLQEEEREREGERGRGSGERDGACREEGIQGWSDARETLMIRIVNRRRGR